jgi:hypothetical protein
VEFLSIEPSRASVEGEVRAAADRRPISADGLEPALRALQESQRGHQHASDAGMQRHQDIYEAHIVKQGQPRQQ